MFLTKVLKVVEYIAKQLVDGYKAGDNETKSFLDKYDFYMFPIVNPDGESLSNILLQSKFSHTWQALFSPKLIIVFGARTVSHHQPTLKIRLATVVTYVKPHNSMYPSY